MAHIVDLGAEKRKRAEDHFSAMKEIKLGIAVIVRSADGQTNWTMVPPPGIPAFLYAPEVFDRLRKGFMAQDEGLDQHWYRIAMLDELTSQQKAEVEAAMTAANEVPDGDPAA